MEDKRNEHIFPGRESLVTTLARHIGDTLRSGVQENGRASLAVSGGSTPVPLFEALSHLPLPWEHVQVTLVDERWVAPTAQDSNERLVRQHLLQNRAAGACFTGMKNQADSAGAGEKSCEEEMQKVKHPFDLLILGMGNDGHTASLFPGATRLKQAVAMDSGRSCVAIAPVNAPHERMSLTLPAILEAREIILHITGQDKKEVLERAFGEGPEEEMPIRFVLRQHITPVHIYWAE